MVDRLDPIFATLAPGAWRHAERTKDAQESRSAAEQGYMHCGPAGAGHFVKMVHNGIEYGLMQAYAEGFDILQDKSSTDLPEDAALRPRPGRYRRGLAPRQRGLILAARPDRLGAGRESRRLSEFTGNVSDSGEGRWTIEAAIEEAVPAAVLTAALYARFRSRTRNTFGEKLLSGDAQQVRRPCRNARLSARMDAAEQVPGPGNSALLGRAARRPRAPS